METVVVLFTRDLRVHDNPALAAACRVARTVVPLFVHDPALRVGANRAGFLAEALADLRGSLRKLGGDLLELAGDPVAETMRIVGLTGAEGIAIAADVSAYARRREQRLAEACGSARVSLRLFPGATIVPPSAVTPAGGDHYQVFTPYWRRWQAAKWRDLEAVPRSIALPSGLPPSVAPALLSLGGALGGGARAGGGFAGGGLGGEGAARARLTAWLPELAGYDEHHDDLPGDGTSRLSPYLHFGCLSPREVAARAEGRPGAEPFLRQLCWRDFYAQVLAAFPQLRSQKYRASAQEDWRPDEDAIDAWRTGHTGVPVVDAGMRQLATEGWMHNRARLITASYLTKHLGQDWRTGGEHFFDLLLDADVANNYGNWQWVAGTGNDTKPYRRFNPIRQAERFDPDGTYVRRYVPELADVPGRAVHQPWQLPPERRRTLNYPDPLPTRAQ